MKTGKNITRNTDDIEFNYKDNKLKVLSITEDQFYDAINKIKIDILKFDPDKIIVIGGGAVPIFKALNIDIPFIHVQSSRVGKSIRENFLITAILKILPLFLKDSIRLMESNFIGTKKSQPSLDSSILDNLSNSRLYVLDDAVDSGGTMDSICRSIPSGNIIRRGAVVVTTDIGKSSVDFTVYRNVLVRFPWKRI